ncbi:predicted protein [Haematococcus lacustris]|uniref:Uncharacterized protein n=1 Tax=Haematococcus lacustris TaxID=44745 RepID=A0A6A0A7B7_HAELA|nr:predicted protein [Haematococcus lacustris]
MSLLLCIGAECFRLQVVGKLSQHKSFAGTYIAKWAQQEEREADVKGTGGTNFMPALGGYQATTAKHRLQQAG